MKDEIKYPKLSIVGAGPGDIDLITVKGVETLGTADVVLYDALVNKELLKYAPIDAIKIFVGKRKNDHAYSQEQINNLIVKYAINYGHVVRLKGGDSFVFGRGYEEIAHAELFGIETAIVPGLSSSIAVPALQGIPVTNRGTSESFWVITGTTSKGKLSVDIKLAAQSTATVVILMGLNKLSEIVEVYKKQKKENAAIAVIQNGSLPTENVVVSTILSIEEVVESEKISAPAIIVIGDVVKLHPQYLFAISGVDYLSN